MKSLTLLTTLFILMSCQHEIIQPNPTKQPLVKSGGLVVDSFGLKSFNHIKRKITEEKFYAESEVDSGMVYSLNKTTTTAPQPLKHNVIYLNFDGSDVSGTHWNYSSQDTMHMEPSGLTVAQKKEVFDNFLRKYSDSFQALITTYRPTYDQCDPVNRMEVIFTQSYKWYGADAGGVSYINSFSWGNNTPCFIFTTLLSYDTKYIKEAGVHEAGHTLGLYHQSSWDTINCIKLNEYNYGCCGHAPIMGVAYYQDTSEWIIGTNSFGCHNIQDDKYKIAQKIRYRHPNGRPSI